MKRTVEVSIMGQKFMVRSDSDEAYVEQIADFVNAKIAEITSKSKSIPSLNVVILAAMNIADEFMRRNGQSDEVVAGLEKKVQGMIELIDLQL
jgi:cell division protein ZapA